MIRSRLLVTLIWLIAALMGALDAYTSRHTMNGDGISYLDMGDAYFRGDWNMAINGLWSPFYSWLLGIAMLLFRPSPYWEFAVVHLVNFTIYVFALSCFHYFLLGLIRHHQQISLSNGNESAALPKYMWFVLGYSLFIWSSLRLITLKTVTPDMLVAAFVYLACGVLLRIRTGSSTLGMFVLLGVVLGFGYLAKAYMFLMAFLFIGVSSLWGANLRRALLCAFTALVVLLLVGGPFFIALSKAKGRLTFGDAGKLNYAWDVNRLTKRHWQGNSPGDGRPAHPTRKIHDVPAAFEFGSPVGGTYPFWYDPSYWNEGVKTRFALIELAMRALKNGYYYYELLFGLPGAVIIGAFLLFYMSGSGWLAALRQTAGSWPLLVPALVGLGLFLPLHIHGRFIAPWITIGLLALFGGVRLTDKRLVAAVTITILMTFILVMGPLTARDAILFVRGVFIDLSAVGDGFFSTRSRTQRNIFWEVAENLKSQGLNSGDKIASISYSNPTHPRWARLARVQIVAEVYNPEKKDEFWATSSDTRQKILDAFRNVGARLVVADSIPYWASNMVGWQKVGETGYYSYWLQ